MKVSGLRAMIKNRWNRDRIYCKPEFWDAKAEEYEDTAVSGWANSTVNTLYDQRELDILRASFPHVEGAHVLDVGCGTGRVARYFASQRANVLGIDFSEQAINVARQQGPPGNPNYRIQSVFKLNEHEQFDIALSLGCLSVACANRDELHAALTNLFNSLKPGGKILLVEPIHRWLLHLVLNMSVREFQEVMREVGFAVQEVTPLHFWPIVRPMAYFNFPRFITTAGYHLGDWALTLLGGTYFGDYKAILALRPDQ